MAVLSAEDPDQAIQSVLHSLTHSARRSNLDRCAVLDAALDAIQQGRVSEAQRAGAEQAAHQIVGSAGTFGYPQVSRLASQLELYFSRLASPAGTVNEPSDEERVQGLGRARDQVNRIRTELSGGSGRGHQVGR